MKATIVNLPFRHILRVTDDAGKSKFTYHRTEQAAVMASQDAGVTGTIRFEDDVEALIASDKSGKITFKA